MIDVSSSEHLLTTLRHMALILALRALPFVGYAALSRSVRGTSKLLIGSAYAALVVLLAITGYGHLVCYIVLGVSYYAIVACAVHRVPVLLERGLLTRGGLFSTLVVVFLLVPALLLPGIARITFLVVGWDLVLSSYSYCVDVAAARRRPALGECIFFLLVNPTLVFKKRGHVREQRALPGLRRAASGVMLLFLTMLVLRPAVRSLESSQSFQGGFGPAGAAFLALGALKFLAEYAAHSALASVQIGFMAGLGHEVPERYRLPFLARSPADFWKRWNTYVGCWLRCYLFVPIARSRGTRANAPRALPLAAVFACCGLLHDGYTYLAELRMTAEYTGFFLFAAAIGLSWNAVVRRSKLRIAAPPRRASSERWSALLSRSCMLTIITTTAALWALRR